MTPEPTSPAPTQVHTVLIVGATGSIGRRVVAESLAAGHQTRALVRDPEKAASVLPEATEVAIGDVTKPETLSDAVTGVDAVVFTLGSDGAGRQGAQDVDYAGVRNVLVSLGSPPVRIALMTAIGVTDRAGAYNQQTQAHDWKRRSERLVRASGHPYTIVRPGWFDYNASDQHRLQFLQGDTRRAGNSSDGVIARRQIAQVLVAALTSNGAVGKTFELVAEQGQAQRDLDPMFAALDPDEPDHLDGVRDAPNMPLRDEPKTFLHDLDVIRARTSTQDGKE